MFTGHSIPKWQEGETYAGKEKGPRPREQERYTPQVPAPPFHPAHSGASPHPQWRWHAALPRAGSSAGQVLQRCGHREHGLPCGEPDAGMKWGGGTQLSQVSSSHCVERHFGSAQGTLGSCLATCGFPVGPQPSPELQTHSSATYLTWFALLSNFKFNICKLNNPTHQSLLLCPLYG